jgi:type I restriction enzyme S subunit
MSNVDFGTLFEFIRNGMNIKQDKSGEGLPISRIETISHGVVDPSRVGYAGLSEADGLDWLLQDGDLLFSHINSAELVGKCAIYTGQPSKLVHGMNLLCLRPRRDILDSAYAKYLIRSQGFRGKLAAYINKAVNQASVSIGNLRTIQVKVPPVSEQRRIAAILDQAEALRNMRRAALAHLDTLAKSIFIEMFGDPHSNSRKYKMAPISMLGRVVTGGTPSSTLDGMFDGSVPFVTPGDLESNSPVKRTLTERGAAEVRTVRAGSTLVCCIGATIGKMGTAQMNSAFNQQINAIEWGSTVNDCYGLQVMKFYKAHIKNWGASTTLPILKKSSFEKIEIPVPPIKDQILFSDRMAAVEQLGVSQNQSLAGLEDLFAALQHRAFLGDL